MGTRHSQNRPPGQSKLDVAHDARLTAATGSAPTDQTPDGPPDSPPIHESLEDTVFKFEPRVEKNEAADEGAAAALGLTSHTAQPAKQSPGTTIHQCALRQARRLVENHLGHRLHRFKLVPGSHDGKTGTEFYSYCRGCGKPCFVVFPLSTIVDGIPKIARHRGLQSNFVITGIAAFRRCGRQ